MESDMEANNWILCLVFTLHFHHFFVFFSLFYSLFSLIFYSFPGFLLLLGRCAGQKKTHVGAGAPTMLCVESKAKREEIIETERPGCGENITAKKPFFKPDFLGHLTLTGPLLFLYFLLFSSNFTWPSGPFPLCFACCARQRKSYDCWGRGPNQSLSEEPKAKRDWASGKPKASMGREQKQEIKEDWEREPRCRNAAVLHYTSPFFWSLFSLSLNPISTLIFTFLVLFLLPVSPVMPWFSSFVRPLRRPEENPRWGRGPNQSLSEEPKAKRTKEIKLGKEQCKEWE